jgi:prepilin-type N-terminal cleavage/methylation domain-containing protein
MRALRNDERPADSGVTLVEMLVVMILLSIVGTLVVRATLDSHKLVRITNDQTEGLQDVRVASERLSRDLRDARSVLCNPTGTPAALAAADPNCLYHLQMWIDYNSDYVQQAAETVTWELKAGSHAGQYDMTRSVNGSSVTEARTIVTQLAFGYDLQPGATPPAPGAAHTTTVNVNMSYDSELSTGTTTKTVSFTGRLRNVS